MIAGVDIGGTKIAVGMVDDEGHVRARFETATAAESGIRESARANHQDVAGRGRKRGSEDHRNWNRIHGTHRPIHGRNRRGQFLPRVDG